MRLAGRRTPQVEEWPEFPVNRGALCRKGWSAAGLYGGRERLTTPLVRDRATGELSPVSWDEALDLVAGRLAALRAERGRRLGRGVRRGRADQREGLPARQARPGRARHLADRLQRPLVHVVGRVGRHPRVRAGPGAAVPAGRRRAGRRARARRLQPGRDDAAGRAPPRRAPRPRRAGRRHRPAAYADRGPRRRLRAAGARAPTWRWRSACCTCSWRAGRSTRSTSPPAPPAGRRSASRSPAGGPSGSSGSPGCRPTRCGRWRSCWPASPEVVVLTARGAEQHSTGSDTVLAWINVALALGMPGTPGAGYGCLTGQGNGQGGREHGQKADQLPGYRMIDDPAARAHVAGVWGVEPGLAARQGALGLRAARRARAARRPVGAAGLRLQHRRLRAPGDPRDPAAGVAGPARGRRHGALRDRGAGRRGPAGHPVGRGDRHHDQPRGPGDPAAAGDHPARRGPLGPGRDRGPGRRASARRVAFSTDPEEVFEELGRASAGGKADYAGITYDRIRDEHGVFWPCPEPGHPGTPRMFLDAFAHPDGRARFLAVDHRGPAEVPDADYPVHLTTGRVLAQYQSGAQTRRVRDLPDTGPFVELHPMLAGRIGAVDGEPVTVATRRGTMTAPARVVATIRPDTVFVPFHWVGANRLDQRRARPGLADAGVQGVRGGGERMIEGMRERLVVVGGGMAAVRFVEELCSRGLRRRGHRPRRRGPRAVQPDPAVGRPRGHPQPRRAHAALGGVVRRPGRRPAPRRPGARGRPRGARGDAGRRRADRLRPAGAGHRVDPDAAADPRAGPPGRVAAPEGPRLPLARRLPAPRRGGPIGGRAERDVRAVVVGGGLLGLQVARALTVRGVATEVVEGAPHLLASQLGARRRAGAGPRPAPARDRGLHRVAGGRDDRGGAAARHRLRAERRPGRAHRRWSALHGAGPPGRA